MRPIHQASALALLALSAFLILEVRGYHYYTEIGPGAGFFPLWLGFALALLSVVWFAQVSLQPARPVEEGFVPDRGGAIRTASILLALTLFTALVSVIGYRVSMFGFLLFLLNALGRRNQLLTLIIAAAGSFGLDYVFGQWLGVHLPTSSIDLFQNLGL